MIATHGTQKSEPALWKLALAFAIVYLSWGTTYFAIKEGVKTLPPALFAGPRLAIAGAILLGWLVLRGESLRLTWSELGRLSLSAAAMFMGGNWLITLGEKTVDSGVASVLVATTPLFMAIMELLCPWGERLTWKGWLGLLSGMVGVVILLGPKLDHPTQLLEDLGPLLVLGSAFCWALGSLILRYGRQRTSVFVAAGYQMLVGGLGLTAIGIALGEVQQLTREALTVEAVTAFFYLLVVGSLLGFVAYAWLLANVSAAMAGTYAYVNPLVAIFVGWLLGGEEITVWILTGMAVILGGVALVRSGGVRPRPARPSDAEASADEPGQSRLPQKTKRLLDAQIKTAAS
jgi:drug/metabolite transporter (DMT)-like permease